MDKEKKYLAAMFVVLLQHSNLIADEKGLRDLGQVVVWIIHLYLYIYWSNVGLKC